MKSEEIEVRLSVREIIKMCTPFIGIILFLVVERYGNGNEYCLTIVLIIGLFCGIWVQRLGDFMRRHL